MQSLAGAEASFAGSRLGSERHRLGGGVGGRSRASPDGPHLALVRAAAVAPYAQPRPGGEVRRRLGDSPRLGFVRLQPGIYSYLVGTLPRRRLLASQQRANSLHPPHSLLGDPRGPSRRPRRLTRIAWLPRD